MIDLVARASEGDHVAFERLAAQITTKLDAIARLMLLDRELAEDAVQEALVRMWQGLPGLRDRTKFDAWSRRLVINACNDELRRRQSRGVLVDISAMVRGEPDESARLADRDELAVGLRRLKPDQRAVLVLRYYLGLEPAEIAETLGIAQGTARSRLHNAIDALRAALAAEARTARLVSE